MKNIYYTKDIKCPICLLEFSTTKVRMSAVKVERKDEDFCVYYKDHNPIYYDIFICPSCGYASSENSFNKLEDREKEILIKAFFNREIGRNFCGIRSHTDALDSYKIALYTASLIGARKSNMAGLALKTAWLYRYTEDEKEKDFLKMALDFYLEAYDKESFPVNNMDEHTVIYLIGELSRRLELYEESINWFNRLVSHPDGGSNIRIQKMAREQWRVVRGIMKKI